MDLGRQIRSAYQCDHKNVYNTVTQRKYDDAVETHAARHEHWINVSSSRMA